MYASIVDFDSPCRQGRSRRELPLRSLRSDASSGRRAPAKRGWAYALFGVAEPAVNVLTTGLVTVDASLFVRLLFAGAPPVALEHWGALVPTLCRKLSLIYLQVRRFCPTFWYVSTFFCTIQHQYFSGSQQTSAVSMECCETHRKFIT